MTNGALTSTSVIGTACVALASLSQCLNPTEIIVDIDTNVACSVVGQYGVAIAIGDPGDEDAGVNTVSNACSPDGSVGTVVLTPNNWDDPVGIRVMLGVDLPAEQCVYPSYGDGGCIVARRSLYYTPHTPLTLPIELDSRCIGVPCTPGSTCQSGSCVDASVPCTTAECDLPDAAPACNVGPTTIASFTAVNFAATPHIAKSAGGYLVTWQPTATELDGVSIDGSGNLLSPIVTFPVAALGTPTFGPLGSDMTNYAVTSADTTGFLMALYSPQGAPLTTSAYSWPAGALPLGGVLWDASVGHYIVATAVPGSPPNTQPMMQLLTLDPKAAPAVFTNITSGGGVVIAAQATDITLVQGGPTDLYVGLTVNGQCTIIPCKYNGTDASCSTYTPVTPTGGCTVMRTAATSAHLYTLAYNAATPQFVAGIDSTSQGNVALPIDDPTAYMLLPTPTIRIVYHGAGAIETMTFPFSTPTSLSSGPTGYPPGAGAGFDAVADGAGSSSYAVVYAQSGSIGTSIEFVHPCN